MRRWPRDTRFTRRAEDRWRSRGGCGYNLPVESYSSRRGGCRLGDGVSSTRVWARYEAAVDCETRAPRRDYAAAAREGARQISNADELLLITGATGLVGSHVAEWGRREGRAVRALVRRGSDTSLLRSWGVELIEGDLLEPERVQEAVEGVTQIVHCAAKVGDWGPVEEYRAVNVRSLEHLLTVAEAAGRLTRFVHVSSLGVYEARDHYGTDETTPPSTKGIDGYTKTKVEAEELVLRHVRDQQLPGVVLRPGFIYGPRDRTVLPRLLERLKKRQVKLFGSGEQLMNNTYVGNLVDAIGRALAQPVAPGSVYNITDPRLVSKKTFIATVAELAGYPVPKGRVPLGLAGVLVGVSEGVYRGLGKKEAPLLSSARYKFLGLNLDFCIDKARRELGYAPPDSFEESMRTTIDWFRGQGML